MHKPWRQGPQARTDLGQCQADQGLKHAPIWEVTLKRVEDGAESNEVVVPQGHACKRG